ncbi:DUF3189 family protein [Natroniella acetigena]|uniref:DUF3189 family protein n=1 Tax=Natroniella acetigena TaxID=52004 RepID=UPI00200A1166|nr:DUF3189 family protein [Natroniella acetigena]MCK8826547.1 DUF3189 family protein [Natroniella acetigena]
MKIIYYGEYSLGLPLIVASFYLGIINTKEELEDKLTMFELNNEQNSGELISIGIDELGNEVFVLGCKDQVSLVKRMLLGFKEIFMLDNEVLLIETTPFNNSLIKIGKILIKLGFGSFGFSVVKSGIKSDYAQIKQQATKIKERITN